jgi:hypothetical protein
MMMFSSISYAEWTFVTETSRTKFYVDFSRVEKNNGRVYYWELIDYDKPDKWKDLSAKTLYEADCNIPRKIRPLNRSYYNQSMARGPYSKLDTETREWVHPFPGSAYETIMKSVCSY